MTEKVCCRLKANTYTMVTDFYLAILMMPQQCQCKTFTYPIASEKAIQCRLIPEDQTKHESILWCELADSINSISASLAPGKVKPSINSRLERSTVGTCIFQGTG